MDHETLETPTAPVEAPADPPPDTSPSRQPAVGPAHGAGRTHPAGATPLRAPVDSPAVTGDGDIVHHANRAERTLANASGRAGRNLTSAVGIGFGLGAAILLSLFLVRQVFAVLATVAAVIGVLEIAGALARRGIVIPRLPVLASTVAITAAALLGGPDALVVVFGLAVTVIVSWTLVVPVRGPRRPTGTGAGPRTVPDARDTATAVFTTAYVPLLAAFAVMLLRPDDGAWRVLTLVLLVVCSDLGGFVAGVVWGRHPLAPRISPKKSWEGLAGSGAASVVAGVVAAVVFFSAPWWTGVLLGLVTVVVATLGDLGESMIKRDLGIKDMSSLLPGHGGLMDRMDSMLAAAPVVWLALTFLVAPLPSPWG